MQVTRREAEMDELALTIQEIDDQIQSKRIEKSSTLETVQKRKAELTSKLANTANSIPTLVHEIQLLLSQISKWEQEKASNAKRVAEIEEKLITLRGLTF
ncbi:hypothetical protein D0Y65_002454 [Glycine soja]|uniref:Uncharacterized protein n=1 Tax=Glycine soja TaxID=3848 RepID=A0A0B2RDN3_GLYSO|nr:hypothetical protein JHK86_002697 [Glycine max]KHN30479.1 hypothetical protein glysoja_033217 [Glycine soja]RZC31601.1 hypothetical protein D0Y65_002454 [Glycine soja]RZC31602.1 hypothetical protein D0Y65_002454 [Glycine soja]RZC31603.1 hypothetical protein D0Y65_002454 [Glycine soja]